MSWEWSKFRFFSPNSEWLGGLHIYNSKVYKTYITTMYSITGLQFNDILPIGILIQTIASSILH